MSASEITTQRFPDSQALAAALAARVAADLRHAIAARGRAVLAVSGGSTPKHFFEQLSRAELDWSAVSVTLVDERWAPESSERSNARLVKAALLTNQAAAARFVPLYQPEAATPEAGLVALRTRLGELPPRFDAVILGMGNDGHTASFFPGADRLSEALDLNGNARVLPINAAGAGEPRITFTLPALLDTAALYLHIEGDAKREVLDAAQLGQDAAADYPIRAVLTQTRVPLTVYWCP
ncbi:MAG: 6-phosphogluconolactonase [Dyella sp.]